MYLLHTHTHKKNSPIDGNAKSSDFSLGFISIKTPPPPPSFAWSRNESELLLSCLIQSNPIVESYSGFIFLWNTDCDDLIAFDWAVVANIDDDDDDDGAIVSVVLNGAFIFCRRRPSPNSYLRRIVEFQWFFIALSVRPGNNFAIFAHWFPHCWCAWKIILSSSPVQAVFLMLGFRWLCHRSRHCLPIRPFSCRAISVHFFGPYRVTNSMTLSSSSFVHGPLINSGLTTLVQRCWHWTSERSFRNFDMLSHRSPCCSTSDFSAASYVGKENKKNIKTGNK